MSRPTASIPRRLFWSRWLVLAVLSLTLPLQGALAATMGVGMALMSSQAPDAVMTMPSDCHDMTGMADMMDMTGMTGMTGMTRMAGIDPAAHGAGVSAMDHAAPHDASPHDASPDDTDHSSDHHCGICLQCCIGAALPIAPLTLAAQDLRDPAPVRGALGAPEQSPQPLERPPKAFLA